MKVTTRVSFFILIIIGVSLSISQINGNYVLPIKQRPVFENHVYVWQRAWNPGVSDAIINSAAAFDGFSPLAAELTTVGGKTQIQYVPMDLNVFGRLNKRVCASIRAHELPGIESDIGREHLLEIVNPLFDDWRQECTLHNFSTISIQLDYDCSTENLLPYSKLLALIKRDNPDIELSITTLPTWLQSDDFLTLVSPLDYFVLQVHSFKRFGSKGEKATLCETENVAGWAAKADSMGVPFYIAWPTYGHLLHYSQNGTFLALQSEESEEGLDGTTVKVVYANPISIAEEVGKLREMAFNNYRGNIWFRLPIASDKLNWTWDTLALVMRGKIPPGEVSAELRNPSENLYEVWIKNKDNYTTHEKIGLNISFMTGIKMYHDTFNGFSFTLNSGDDAGRLSGIAPRANTETLAAWFRLEKNDDNIQHPIVLSAVEILR